MEVVYWLVLVPFHSFVCHEYHFILLTMKLYCGITSKTWMPYGFPSGIRDGHVFSICLSGSLALGPKKTGEDSAKETVRVWSQRLTVKLTVQNRQAKVAVVPSAAPLVIKALKEPERDRKKVKNIKDNGSISLDDVIEIAKIMPPRSMAKQLAGTVKEISAPVSQWAAPLTERTQNSNRQSFDDGEVEIPIS